MHSENSQDASLPELEGEDTPLEQSRQQMMKNPPRLTPSRENTRRTNDVGEYMRKASENLRRDIKMTYQKPKHIQTEEQR